MRYVLSVTLTLFLAGFRVSAAHGRPLGQAAATSEIQRHFQAADADLKANNPQAALKEYDAILALDPRNAEALANRGAIHFLSGDCAAAAPDLRAALKFDAALSRARAMLGLCALRSGDRAAPALLESAYAKLPAGPLRTQTGMELASYYYRQGDLERASRLAQSLVADAPDNPDVLYFAQLVYGELADDTLNKLAILAPNSARMQQVIAERLVNEGDLAGAIKHYRQALALDPRLPGVHYELGEAILESNPHDSAAQAQAQTEFGTAAKLEGDSARIEAELGRIAMLQSDSAAAFEHYWRALELNPRDTEAQVGMGRVLMLRGKDRAAVNYLREAIQEDPLNSEAHYRLGTAYRRLGMTGQSVKELKLFEDIKRAEDQVKALYQQMNKRPPASGMEPSDAAEQN